MRKETYIKMTQPFRENPKLAKSLHMANKILTGLVFIAYPCLLLWMLWHKDPRLTNAIIYPMNGFICVTVVRAILNFPRPYERFEMPPANSEKHKRTFLAKQACVFRNDHCTYIFPGQYAAGNRIACMCGRDCGDPCDFRCAQYQ